MNGYPSFYPKIALVAPSPGEIALSTGRVRVIGSFPTQRNYNADAIDGMSS